MDFTIETMNLWEKVPGMCEEVPQITAYIPKEKTSDAAIVIFPGGAYGNRAKHEGKGYAEFLAGKGVMAFDVAYRIKPHKFPIELLDARRAVQFVRYYADKYSVNKDKVAVMGSSAGGHLAALTSTYFEEIDGFDLSDDISKESYIPDMQILCYPVIRIADADYIKGWGSVNNLLGSRESELVDKLDFDKLVNEKTPPAFIWHTFLDEQVMVTNSLDYAKALHKFEIPTEIHIYPHGNHGLGIPNPSDKLTEHISQWGDALIRWIDYIK